jgi:hypothetical protein
MLTRGRVNGRRYLIDFARGRPTNPARTPVSLSGCWYYILFPFILLAGLTAFMSIGRGAAGQASIMALGCATYGYSLF